MKFPNFFFGAPFLFSTIANAMPAQVIIIRHAEKPVIGNELSLKGRERAEALARWFDQNPSVNRYGSPVAVYAADQKDSDSSVRMIQTVTPLAKRYNLPVLHPFHREQVKKMFEELKAHPEYEGKTVVVCWQSETIPKLAKALGAEQAPKKWSKRNFDRAWVLKFRGDQVTAVEDIPQKLLPEDAKQ